jgi:hypothetical protein
MPDSSIQQDKRSLRAKIMNQTWIPAEGGGVKTALTVDQLDKIMAVVNEHLLEASLLEKHHETGNIKSMTRDVVALEEFANSRVLNEYKGITIERHAIDCGCDPRIVYIDAETKKIWPKDERLAHLREELSS